LIPLRRSRPNRGECLTLTEKDLQEAFQNAGEDGTGVYMQEGTTSRVMAANCLYGEFYDIYSVSPEYFGLHHVLCTCEVVNNNNNNNIY
jgi:hypothetical protein